MLACRIHAKEDLRIEPQEPPVPGAGEVPLALGAGGICGSDVHALSRAQFDVTYQASGSIKALAICVGATKPGGTIVHVGTLPDERAGPPGGQRSARARRYLSSRRVDVRPLLTGRYPPTDARRGVPRRGGQDSKHEGAIDRQLKDSSC